jgi:hypothetical protein
MPELLKHMEPSVVVNQELNDSMTNGVISISSTGHESELVLAVASPRAGLQANSKNPMITIVPFADCAKPFIGSSGTGASTSRSDFLNIGKRCDSAIGISAIVSAVH